MNESPDRVPDYSEPAWMQDIRLATRAIEAARLAGRAALEGVVSDEGLYGQIEPSANS